MVSAVFGGLPALAVERASREEVWISPEVREEWLGLAGKLEGRLVPDQVTALKALLLAVIADAREAEVRQAVRLCRDPADDAYLSLAAAAKADFLLTGDKDLLTIPPKALRDAGLGRLTIADAREFLRLAGKPGA